LGKINNLLPKIHLYTVPGQSYYEASRKLVLRGADGVVFVADSAPECVNSNLLAWQDLETHLASNEILMGQIPIVLQCNKQDLYNALTPVQISYLLHANLLPTLPAIARQGAGVFDTLKTITRNVITQIQHQTAIA
jgi:signal recognition particle receptor subunit beta